MHFLIPFLQKLGSMLFGSKKERWFDVDDDNELNRLLCTKWSKMPSYEDIVSRFKVMVVAYSCLHVIHCY